jgi:hypothetical protein
LAFSEAVAGASPGPGDGGESLSRTPNPLARDSARAKPLGHRNFSSTKVLEDYLANTPGDEIDPDRLQELHDNVTRALEHVEKLKAFGGKLGEFSA